MIRVVAFDWGDTVMQVFPGYGGPMALWPRVEAVPGIADALRSLRPRYRLVLATNAAESGEELVREALRRADLEEYFDAVFTAREMGARKPDPAFFEGMLHGCGCDPVEAAIVGDDYLADVAGPRRVGLWAIWFNPAASPCPLPDPLHNAEIRSMAELPPTLETLRSPV